MPFEKGKSGNPGGLTSRDQAIKRRLGLLTFKAVAALERVLDDDAATHGERLAAAREVFDRAIGKAKQQATISVEHGPNAHLAALLGLTAKTVERLERGNDLPRMLPQAIEIIEHDTNHLDLYGPNVDVNEADDATY